MANGSYPEWPLVKANGELMLLIPLEIGAANQRVSSRVVSETKRDFLKIVIPPWLAEMLDVGEGDLLRVSNEDGELQIQPVESRLVN
jgi:predicted molibdopterin-dependent oxidoreductase YjgC